MRLWIAIALVIAFGAASPGARAQSDDMPLGDVARSYRKAQAPPQKVIDNDNLPQVMEQGENKKWAAAPKPAPPKPSVQLINFQSPNVTCALSFSGGRSDPLANAPRPERLPDEELSKVEGPASIVGDTLELSVLNGSAWDLREITVGLTIVRKQVAPAVAFLIEPAKLIPSAPAVSDHKQPDTTLVYHVQGSAAPYSSAVFREVLDRPLGPDEEWHWSILQAKGFPPAQPAPTDQPAPTSPATKPDAANPAGAAASAAPANTSESPKK